MIRNPNPPPDRGRPTRPAPATNGGTAPPVDERRGHPPVLKTTRTPSGQVLDWVAIESQHPQGRIATPPPTPARVQRFDPARRPATFEMDDPSIERGPPGTVPMLRRHIADADAAGNGHDVRRKRKVDGRRLMPRSGRAPADAAPDPFGYYHATSAQWATCYGCQAVLNMWDPYTEYSSDHSISQFGIQNYDNPDLQSIEAGWEVCHDQYGDWLPHLFTYFTTNGYRNDGDNVGGYNRVYRGWVQYDPNIYPGALINGSSTYGGNQDVITIKFQLYQGNWWFQVQGIWLGYYPAALFTGGPGGPALGDHGEWVAFWGEVYSSLSDPSRTTTWMGSGNFAEDGWTWSAYQSNTQIQIDGSGTMADSDGSASAENPAMYDIRSDMLSGSSWASYFWFGGPGA
jgi:hypothetical protein